MEYTFYGGKGRLNEGNSAVDHICIDEGALHVVENMEVKEDVMEKIKTDHCMVSMTCNIRNINVEGKKYKRVTREKRKIKAGRGRQINRIGDRKVWEEYRKRCRTDSELGTAIAREEERRKEEE